VRRGGDPHMTQTGSVEGADDGGDSQGDDIQALIDVGEDEGIIEGEEGELIQSIIEFGETRRISLARPDRLRIDEVASDGASDLALFDGKQITVLSADDNVYAQAPQPPSIEDALVYFVRDLHMRMPLALLLSTHVSTELPILAKEVDYVESTQIRGQAAHHLAGRGDSVDFQIWIAEGTKPLPLRIVITYKLAPAQPTFAADISDWNIGPSFSGKTFQFSLPKDARKIPFAVQLVPPDAAPQPAAAGEVKP